MSESCRPNTYNGGLNLKTQIQPEYWVLISPDPLNMLVYTNLDKSQPLSILTLFTRPSTRRISVHLL